MTIVQHVLTAFMATEAIQSGGKKYVKQRWLRILLVGIIAIPLGFISHFPMDMIPHWDPNFKLQEVGVLEYLFVRKLLPDLIFAIWLLIGHWCKWWNIRYLCQSWTALLAGVASMVPDVYTTFWPLFFEPAELFKTFTRFHGWMHTDINPGRFWGMVIPFIVTSLQAAILMWLAKQSSFLSKARVLLRQIWKSEQFEES